MVTDPRRPRKPSMTCWWARTTDISPSMSSAASFCARTDRGIRENVAVGTIRQRGEVPRQTLRHTLGCGDASVRR